MRIARVAPLGETLPPKLYGETERVVAGGGAGETLAPGYFVCERRAGDGGRA